MSVVRNLGYIAVGTRFRILTDRLMLDADKIYKSLGLEFEPRWFTVFYLINQKSPVTISELTDQLGYSQPAVTQIVNALIRKKLIHSAKEKGDSRKKLLTITQKGKDLVLKLIPVWQDIENGVKELFNSTGYDVLHIISRLESELDSKDIYSRVMEKTKNRQRSEVKILDYDPKYKNCFRDLNYEWISKYFKIEKKDKQQLEHPEKEIIQRGGFILFAQYENEITGTAALLKHGENEFELAKMAVTEKAQGKQIGKKLALAAIKKAKLQNAETLFLETNSALLPALNLYKNLGFVEVEMKKQSDYKRATLCMELNLKKVNKILI